MSFETLGLSAPLLRGIQAAGYDTPTAIQSQAIPIILEGHDLVACAQTGTGKTAAFVLPMLERLASAEPRGRRTIRALILTPTRELAVQIERCMEAYGHFLRLRTCCIYGGVSIQKQLQTLHSGVDIVVATPGRLLDHLGRRSINLTAVELLVLDEAGRMFDMGFIHEVRRIVAGLPGKRQTLLFSACLSPEIKKLAADMQQAPRVVTIGQPRNPIETVTQHIYPVRKELKIDLLLHMLANNQMDSVLVFSRTKHGADKICRKIQKAGITSAAIHSNRSQCQRQSALDGFRNGRYQVMVATDVAARGIDIEGLSHVVNFDVPAFAEDYIHRIGRTGRATANGDAITLVAPEEKSSLHNIEKFIGRNFEAEYDAQFDYEQPPSALSADSYRERQLHDARLAAPAQPRSQEPSSAAPRSAKRRHPSAGPCFTAVKPRRSPRGRSRRSGGASGTRNR